jgi:hypothetical protein
MNFCLTINYEKSVDKNKHVQYMLLMRYCHTLSPLSSRLSHILYIFMLKYRGLRPTTILLPPHTCDWFWFYLKLVLRNFTALYKAQIYQYTSVTQSSLLELYSFKLKLIEFYYTVEIQSVIVYIDNCYTHSLYTLYIGVPYQLFDNS